MCCGITSGGEGGRKVGEKKGICEKERGKCRCKERIRIYRNTHSVTEPRVSFAGNKLSAIY